MHLEPQWQEQVSSGLTKEKAGHSCDRLDRSSYMPPLNRGISD